VDLVYQADITDPEEFSTRSTSPLTSPTGSPSIEVTATGAKPGTRFEDASGSYLPRMKELGDTPMHTPPLRPFTPLGGKDFGVKGILRPVGTPGSGNGGRYLCNYTDPGWNDRNRSVLIVQSAFSQRTAFESSPPINPFFSLSSRLHRN
jgi:hypothetical protein